MASVNLQDIIAAATVIGGAVQDGKILVEEVLAFAASKGVDQQELDAVRASLVSDVSAMEAELAADEAQTQPPAAPPTV